MVPCTKYFCYFFVILFENVGNFISFSWASDWAECFADDEQGDHETAQTEPLQLPLQYSNAWTQWEVQALTDHTYVSGDKIMLHKATQFHSEDPLALAILKNDTGFTLSDFKEHFKYLPQFYTFSFNMHIMDQILMTMMKLNLNLLQGDLAECFYVSPSLVSQIISYWIDTMEEHMRHYMAFYMKFRMV